MNLFCLNFGIKLDCPLSTCAHEILIHLDPKPVEEIDEFLTFLDEEKIPYACLSNTVYTMEDTKALIETLIPNHHFQFVLTSGDVAVKKENNNQEKATSNDELLFRYVELYEKGLITREEFDKKKKELL